MARQRAFQRPGRTRRSVLWGFGPQEVDGAFTASNTAIWSAGITTALGEITIMRTRGRVRSILTAAGSPGDGYRGAHGIAVVQDQAFGIGLTAVPNPLDEADWDGWLWHSFFDVCAVMGTIADGVNAVGCISDIEIDSKAMRKWGSNQTIMGITQVVESGVAVLEVFADTRMLAKLG